MANSQKKRRAAQNLADSLAALQKKDGEEKWIENKLQKCTRIPNEIQK